MSTDPADPRNVIANQITSSKIAGAAFDAALIPAAEITFEKIVGAEISARII